jgi:hypothetical protein
MKTYYNTNNEMKVELDISKRKALSQQELVLEIFQQYQGRRLGPSDILHYFPGVPITSIRRAITNLTSAGLLEKTDKFSFGNYGKVEHLWQLAEPRKQLQTSFLNGGLNAKQ